MTWEIRVGHVLDVLAEMPSESVQCVVTSPPYWALRAVLWYNGWLCQTSLAGSCRESTGDPISRSVKGSGFSANTGIRVALLEKLRPSLELATPQSFFGYVATKSLGERSLRRVPLNIGGIADRPMECTGSVGQRFLRGRVGSPLSVKPSTHPRNGLAPCSLSVIGTVDTASAVGGAGGNGSFTMSSAFR